MNNPRTLQADILLIDSRRGIQGGGGEEEEEKEKEPTNYECS